MNTQPNGQPIRVAINGFGRIGRLVFRAWLEARAAGNAHALTLDIVAINDLATLETSAHLLNYDSVHGRLSPLATLNGDKLRVGDVIVTMLRQADAALLPWRDLKIDMVMDCTGRFTKRAQAEAHLTAGAKRVLISAPATDEDLTVVYGVNHMALTDAHKIVSNASCTTNCLAPVAAVLHAAIGIDNGFMTTIHSYTGDQRLVDTFHEDPYRARAAALSMIPTTTGAAKAVGKVLPALAGKLDGTAIRVPTPNVSAVDLTFSVARDTTVDEINAALVAASENDFADLIATTTAPLVSIDLNHSTASATVALDQTRVVGGRMARVFAWYDNEWGFSNRMLDVAGHWAGL